MHSWIASLRGFFINNFSFHIMFQWKYIALLIVETKHVISIYLLDNAVRTFGNVCMAGSPLGTIYSSLLTFP